MRKVIWIISIIIAFIFCLYAYQVWINNRSVSAPTQEQIQTTLEKAIVWLDHNRDKILEQRHPMLWRMIQQAAEISNDQRLNRLFTDYEQRYLERHKNVWNALFYPGTWAPYQPDIIANFPYYNLYFIYAILCDRDLGILPEIVEQNDPAFCDQHPMTPACVTHQLMGIRLLQRSQCGDAETLDDTVQQLQVRIHRQLQLDPRVVDIYMQRVLMLVESDAKEMVKPVWIQSLIEAQQADGGWSPFQPLVPLFGDYYLGYGQKFFSVKQPYSAFHMTAQGVFLFTLLSRHYLGSE